MFNYYFLDFIENYVLYFIVLFYFNYILVIILKFFIQNLIGYDLWTYIDDSIRICPNNTSYDICSDTYVLDYEYFNITNIIYYHNNFLDPNLELKYYFDFYPEFKNGEEEDHELYGLMSTYIIPLQYKYYILEHYWPEDEKVSMAWPNFYNFYDLNSEFKFIYEDYKILWPNYKKFFHSKELIYNDKLYDSKILQIYYYKMKRFIKAPLSNLIVLNSKKTTFCKKEFRTFDLVEPSKELSVKKYFTWFLLKNKYDEAKFEYDVFCNLPLYDIFDKNPFDCHISSFYGLIDMQTKRQQYIENTDEYFLDFINSENLINYYFNMNLIKEYQRIRFDECDFEYDKPMDPFDYLFFLFGDRGIIMLGYLILFYYYCYFFTYFFVCYFCWFNHVYAFDFDLYIEPLRMLTRHRYFNDYSDYNFLIFNYTKFDINNYFFSKNIKLKLEPFYQHDDKIKLPRNRSLFFEKNIKIELERFARQRERDRISFRGNRRLFFYRKPKI